MFHLLNRIIISCQGIEHLFHIRKQNLLLCQGTESFFSCQGTESLFYVREQNACFMSGNITRVSCQETEYPFLNVIPTVSVAHFFNTHRLVNKCIFQVNDHLTAIKIDRGMIPNSVVNLLKVHVNHLMSPSLQKNRKKTNFCLGLLLRPKSLYSFVYWSVHIFT